MIRCLMTTVCDHCGITFQPKRLNRQRPARFCCRPCADAGKYGSTENRFWRHVIKGPACWNYRVRTGRGYGCLQITGKHIVAHRLSWELHHGPIPPGLVVCHKCDNRACVRPDHLFIGTVADNIADMVQKDRHWKTGPKNPCHGEQHGSSRLRNRDILKIRQLHAKGISQLEIGRQFGMSQAHISKVILRKVWRHVI